MDTTDDGGNCEGLVIALLDFPKGGTFGLDGQHIVLKTDDFLGVKDVKRNAFHLVTCKTGASRKNDGQQQIDRNTIDTAVTVGFLVFGGDDNNDGHLVRKYDPQTEEAASEERSPVDAITKKNLVQQMTDGSLPPSRVLKYDQIMSGSGSGSGRGCNTTHQEEQQFSQQRIWREITRHIYIEPSSSSGSKQKPSLLKDLRGLSSGDKIVPGCYDPEDETSNDDNSMASKEVDGRSLVYPPIPVVDPKLSLAKHKHHGTNRFLSRLQPHERTSLFLAPRDEASANHPNFVWLDKVLKDCYQNSWEALLGDLQLSYILFLYLGCFSSLEHWKDLLAMLSLAVERVGGGDNNNRQQRSSQHYNPHESLYHGLLRMLPYQLASMNDPEFLEDMDEGSGNFLVPSLVRLKRYYDETTKRPPENAAFLVRDEEEDEDSLSKFRHILSAKFPQTFYRPTSVPAIRRIQGNNNSDGGNGDKFDTENRAMDTDQRNVDPWDFEDDDDEDGPVMVSSEEIEASMARSSRASFGGSNVDEATNHQQLRREYPLLAAAMMPSEDVLMTCARALDEKTDVSLVREAAAYLEKVEHRRGFF